VISPNIGGRVLPLSRLVIVIIGLSLATGCSLFAKRDPLVADDSKPVAQAPVSEREGPLLPSEKSAAPNVLDLDLTDVPEEYRHTVLKWIEYYQGRGRPHMQRYLSRSTKFIPLFQSILKKHEMPEDLVYLALIESGFSLRAKSHASAVGPWQFIRGTGSRYGLKIDRWIDERQDPVKSTEAAALYLKGLYNLFGSWYLAIASYNVGEMRIQRSVMKYYTRSFWELAHRKVLPSETIEYIPKFIAAGVIGRHPAKYGFTEINFEKPLQWEEYVSQQTVDLKILARELDIDYDSLADLNAMFKTRYAIVKNGSVTLRIPPGTKEKVSEVIAKSFANVRTRDVATNNDPDSAGFYRVRPGDTLSGIAKRFRTNIATLRDMNDLGRSSMIKVGSRLSVPERGSSRGSKNQSKKKAAGKQSRESKVSKSPARSKAYKPKTQDAKLHVVKPGDTLIQIARRYNISIGKLVSENNLSKRGKVLVGRALIIPE
jgi:membrane-bound lytic murein transglycosylase D